MKLHQQVVDARPAINPQLRNRCCAGINRVQAHGLQQGGALVGNAFKRSARDVADGGAACEPGDRAACIGVPVGCAQAGKGGHHHHAAGVGNTLRERLNLVTAFDGVQTVAKPLHHGTPHKNTAFSGKLSLRAGLCRAGGEQAVMGCLKRRACVHQHEAARAIRVFGHTGFKAGLSKKGALLVTCNAPNNDGMTKQFGAHGAVMRAGRQDLGHE